MSTPKNTAANRESDMLAPRIVVTLLSVRFMQMELFRGILPEWLSDYSYGLMLRLGVLFGLVVLIWHAGFRREFFKIRSGLFLLASVASALLAVWVGRLSSDLFLILITICGAAFLALSHKFILGASWKQLIAAIALAPGMFHLVFFTMNTLPLASSFREALRGYMPCFWQMGYLLGMFGVGAWLKKGTASRSAGV